jgi:hypothetical protein
MLYRVIAWHHDTSNELLSPTPPDIREYRFVRIGETAIDAATPIRAAALGYVEFFGNPRGRKIEELGGPEVVSSFERSAEKVMEITSRWPLGDPDECFLIDNHVEQWLFDVVRIGQ